jgi:hypothetical protein
MAWHPKPCFTFNLLPNLLWHCPNSCLYILVYPHSVTMVPFFESFKLQLTPYPLTPSLPLSSTLIWHCQKAPIINTFHIFYFSTIFLFCIKVQKIILFLVNWLDLKGNYKQVSCYLCSSIKEVQLTERYKENFDTCHDTSSMDIFTLIRIIQSLYSLYDMSSSMI